MRHYFEKVLVVQHRFDNIFDVVRHIGVFGNNGLKCFYLAMNIIRTGGKGSILHIVGRQEAQQLANTHQSFLFIITHKVSDTTLGTVSISATQFFFSYLFIGHRLYHIGTGNKHVALLFHHKDKVGQCRRVAGTTRTRTQDGRNLRNNTRSDGVLIEDRCITGKTVHTFLNTGTARIIQCNNRRTVLQGKFLHLDNLGCIGFTQRTTVCGEVVSIHKNQAAVYLSVTCHHSISGNLFFIHTEIGATVVHQLIQFIERAFVKEHFNTFAGSHLALCMLLLYLVHTATQRCLFVQFLKPAVYFFSCHGSFSLLL